MPKNEVELVLSVETKKALSGLSGFSKTALSSIRKISAAAGDLRNIAAVAVGVFAGRQIIGAIKDLTDAASKQEEAVNALNTAMKTAGDYSADASREMQAFANQMQETTRYGDEQILSQLAIAKAFGATNEQAQKLVRASIELAEAQGKSLDEAVRQVSKSLGGYAGELGEVLPEVKNLTKEQLQNAEVADLLIEKYGGTAAKRVQTFGGAVEQTGNLIGDFRETLGSIITENPAVIATIKGLGDVFKDLIKLTTDNKKEISAFVTEGIKTLLNALPSVIGLAGFVSKGIEGIGIAGAIAVRELSRLILSIFQLQQTEPVITYIRDLFLSLSGVVLNAGALLVDAGNAIRDVFTLRGAKFTIAEEIEYLKNEAPGAAQALRDLAIATTETIGDKIDFTPLITSLKETSEASLEFGTDIESIFAKVQNGIAEVEKTVKTGVDKINAQIDKGGVGGKLAEDIPAAQSKILSFTDWIAGLWDDLSAAPKSFWDSTVAAGESAVSYISNLFGNLNADIGAAITTPEKPAAAGADAQKEAETSLYDTIVSGMQAGAAFLQSALSASVVQELANTVSAIGDMPRQFIAAFKNLSEIIYEVAREFPKIVEELIQRVPHLIQIIVKEMPKLVQALANGMPKILLELAKGLPKIMEVIAKQMPILIDALLDAMPEIIDALLEGMPDVILAIAEGIPQIIQSLAENLPGIIEVLAENMEPIITALTYGIVKAIPTIAAVLIDEFVVKGGALRIAIAIIQGLAGAIVGVAQGFAAGVVDGLKNFKFTKPDWLDRLKIKTPQWLEDFSDAVRRLTSWSGPNLKDVGGSGQGLVPDSVPILGGLATGGLVTKPGAAIIGEAGPELVVRSGTTERLFSLIDQLATGQAPGSDVQIGMLAAIMERLGQPMTVETTAEVNGDALANIILRLSRTNARTAA